MLLGAENVLRSRSWVIQDDRPTRRLMIHLGLLVVVFGFAYGAVLGSFGAIVAGQRYWQIIVSGVKVPILLVATFALSLPFFFVLNTLAGLRTDFGRVLRSLVAMQSGLTIILASFAPFTAVWYVSCSNYHAAILFNGVMFGAASLIAQRLLKRWYHPLIQRRPQHWLLLRIWLVIYAFVGIQMGWILRPFVGAPGEPTQFFREEAWGNAYVKILEIVWRIIAG